MSSQVLLQRQSREKNVQLRRRLLLLYQQLLLHRSLQLLSQLRSQPLYLLKFRRLHRLQQQLLLHNLLQLQRQYQHPRRHIQCLGMNLRLQELQLRLLTTIRCLTAMMM